MEMKTKKEKRSAEQWDTLKEHNTNTLKTLNQKKKKNI